MKTKYKDEIIAAFSEFLYSYAIGHAVRLEGQALLDEMAARLKASGYKPKSLLGMIVDIDAFRMRGIKMVTRRVSEGRKVVSSPSLTRRNLSR